MNILTQNKLDEYHKRIGKQIPGLIKKYDFRSDKIDFFYLTQASAVYSSNIEGNPLDLNSYMNHKLSKGNFKPTKEVEEIDNLVAAYQFAQNNAPEEAKFLRAHKILSKTLLIKSKRGAYRTEKVGVYGDGGLIYVAIGPEFVPGKMGELFTDIADLIAKDLTVGQSFYYASLIHLICAHIHPFQDGNGRSARLLEKWFLTRKLGRQYWKIPSEKYYWDNRQHYYETINLGVNYYELDYNLCLPFLLMLPECLR